MSRFKQNQSIDGMIQGINIILEDRCSFSEEDVEFLNEALTLLQDLKRKKGRTNEKILEIAVQVVEVISKYFN